MSYIVRVFDVDGNEISSEVDKMDSGGYGDELNIHLKQKLNSDVDYGFNEIDVMLLLDLIHWKLHNGVGIDLARNYVELYDKINKIGDKK